MYMFTYSIHVEVYIPVHVPVVDRNKAVCETKKRSNFRTGVYIQCKKGERDTACLLEKKKIYNFLKCNDETH
jgi:hypothetical protein